MLAHSVSTTRRWLGSAALACLLSGAGYAVWAAQPSVPVAIPANGIAADIVLRVDEDAPRTLRIVGEADKPFSLASDANGRRFTIAGTVSRMEHLDKPAMMLQLRIDEGGKRVAEPKLVVLNGKPAAVHLGAETQTPDGGKAFKGLRLDITLTDATKPPAVTMHKSQAGMRDAISELARDHGLTVNGLELIPVEQKVSMGLEGVPLETVLALIGEVMALDARVVGKRIELTRKPAPPTAPPAPTAPAAPPAPPVPPRVAAPAPPPPPTVPAPPPPKVARLQPGMVDQASRALNPPRYPAEALKENKTGVVVLVVSIDAKGGVTNVRVERSSGDARLDVAAQDAASKWLFKPEIKNGKPRASQVRVPVEFALDDPAKQAG